MKRYWMFSAALLVSMTGCSIPRLDIYAGSATDSISGELRSDHSQGTSGTLLDLEGDLSVSDKNYPFNARLAFALSQSILDVSYARRSLSSTATSMPVADFGDVALDVETLDLALQEYRFCVGRRFRFGRGKYTASARAGVFGADWAVELGNPAGQKATADGLAIIPVVGGSLEVKMGPLASFVVEAEGMDADISGARSRLFGWHAGVKISLIQANLMLGYGSRSLEIEDEGDRFMFGNNGFTVAFQVQLSLGM
jgi:hypothetical protein